METTPSATIALYLYKRHVARVYHYFVFLPPRCKFAKRMRLQLARYKVR